MKKDTLSELSKEDRETLDQLILKVKAVKKPISLKQQKKLTCQILKQLPDWEDWKQSEFKQLDLGLWRARTSTKRRKSPIPPVVLSCQR